MTRRKADGIRNITKKRSARALTLVLVLTLALVGSPVHGQTTRGPVHGQTIRGPAEVDYTPPERQSPRERARTLRYWTPERMRQADATGDAIAASTSEIEAKPSQIKDVLPNRGKPTLIPGGPPSARSPLFRPTDRVNSAAGLDARRILALSPGEGYWTGSKTYPPAKQTGRLFYYMPQQSRDSFCTATVVSSYNRSLLWTAGHCVLGHRDSNNNWVGPTWHQRLMFCPGYRPTTTNPCPYGKWTARNWDTTSFWRQNEDFRYDVAVVLMAPYNGWKIGNWVGYQGIYFNAASRLGVYAFGHPGATDSRWTATFTQELYYCRGTNSVATDGNLLLGCTMIGGASGGPWFASFNGYYGYVISVNSNKPNCNIMAASYQGSVAKNLWNTWQYK
jgi:hypothetical protein